MGVDRPSGSSQIWCRSLSAKRRIFPLDGDAVARSLALAGIALEGGQLRRQLSRTNHVVRGAGGPRAVATNLAIGQRDGLVQVGKGGGGIFRLLLFETSVV